jgi:hypothetical protein
MAGQVTPRSAAEIVALADDACAVRRAAEDDAAIMDAISPATPDSVEALDGERTVFRATWWAGNDDARRVAEEDVAVMRASDDIVVLDSPIVDGEDLICVCFAVTCEPEDAGDLVN